MRFVSTFGLGLIVGMILVIALSWSHGQPLTPCEHEDSTGCYWDASKMGNGIGNDFVSP